MKKKLLLITFLLVIGVVKLLGQSFSYDIKPNDERVRVKPIAEKFAFNGRTQFALYIPKDYWIEICDEISKKCLSKSQVEIFSRGGIIFKTYINHKGEIFYVEFIIKKDLLKSISDSELLKLYETLTNIRLDLRRVRAHPSLDAFTDKHVAILSGTLLQ